MTYALSEFRKLFGRLVHPKSSDKNHARQEYILNVLLLGSILLSLLAIASFFIGEIFAPAEIKVDYQGTIKFLGVIFTLFVIGYIFSRAGKYHYVVYSLIALYFIGATYTSYFWGVGVPQALVTYALVVVMSGILIGSGVAFTLVIMIFAVLELIIYLQSAGIILIKTHWKTLPTTPRDVAIYSVSFLIIALVSWLFNREIEKALLKTRTSEIALRKERNLLEARVQERTLQLRQAQAEKLGQLYRFAEFGRSASGVFHELANPLTLVSLNLQKLNESSKGRELKSITQTRLLLDRAIAGTKRLEGFIAAARKQIQSQEVLQSFALINEVKSAIQLLEYRARKLGVNVQVQGDMSIETFGNPIKFNQLITNLLSNAIDAFEGAESTKRLVTIVLSKLRRQAKVQVRDLGCGIQKQHLKNVFDSLFTTKSPEKGTGLGLSLCKGIVEKDFHGSIGVSSKAGKGSTFTVIFPIEIVTELAPDTK